MFTRISDFERQWKHESDTTLKLLKALTDDSLSQSVSPEDRTLGRIAWHIAQTIPEMFGHAGLKVEGPASDAPVPSKAADICSAYQQAASSVLAQVKEHWNDESLNVEDSMYGEQWKRGFTLMALTHHESHHRGQLSVLMRQAGLIVPGIYGPAREEWSSLGMAAPAI